MHKPHANHQTNKSAVGLDPASFPDVEVLLVSAKSNPNSVAGAIAGTLKRHERTILSCIGAGAVNQAVKAVAIARGFVAPHGVDLIAIPCFHDDNIAGQGDRTSMRIIVEPR